MQSNDRQRNVRKKSLIGKLLPLLAISFLAFQMPALATNSEAVKLNNKGVQAIDEGNFPAAISILEHALQLDPNYTVARENLAIAHNNFALSLVGEPEKALVHFHRAVYYSPRNETHKKNLTGLIKRLNKDPDSFEDRVALGDQAKKAEDYLGAEIEYRNALEIKEDPKVRADLTQVTRLADERRVVPPPDHSAQMAALINRVRAAQEKDSGGSESEDSATKAALAKYINAVEEKIQTKWVPPHAQESNEVTTEFKIGPSGKLFDAKVVKSSGSLLWDDSAMEALKHASPFDPLPGGFTHSVQITYSFDFKQQAMPPETGKVAAKATASKNWDDRLIAKMDFSSQWHRSFAEKYGEAYERNSNLSRAKDIYAALIAAMGRAPADDKKTELPRYHKDLARASAFLTLKQNEDAEKAGVLTLQSLKSLDDSHWITESTRKSLLELATESIIKTKSGQTVNKLLAESEGIPVDTRFAITEQLLHASMKSNESTTEIGQYTKELTIYKKKMTNLPDANSATTKAFEMEKSGQFQAAIDDYDIAFKLKERSLGTTDEATLEAESDIARVLDEEGHAGESQKLYEKTVEQFRRFHPYSYRYERLLLSFGDFLARHNQNKKADSIYAEATDLWRHRISEKAKESASKPESKPKKNSTAPTAPADRNKKKDG